MVHHGSGHVSYFFLGGTPDGALGTLEVRLVDALRGLFGIFFLTTPTSSGNIFR